MLRRCNPFGFLDPSNPTRQLLTDSGIQACPAFEEFSANHCFCIHTRAHARARARAHTHTHASAVARALK